MALQLSEGAIAAIMQGENSVKPILQLINIRPISSGSGPPRYRLLMSDGVNTLSSCMLATQLNSMIDDKSLTANAICQINRFIVNTLKDGRRVMIIMDLTVLRAGDASTPKIGNPVQYVEGAGQGVKPLQSPGLASNQAPSQPPQHQNSSTGAELGSSKKLQWHSLPFVQKTEMLIVQDSLPFYLSEILMQKLRCHRH